MGSAASNATQSRFAEAAQRVDCLNIRVAVAVGVHPVPGQSFRHHTVGDGQSQDDHGRLLHRSVVFNIDVDSYRMRATAPAPNTSERGWSSAQEDELARPVRSSSA
jgi:hypothetical protein